jgi:hypothetical protein
VLHQLTGWALAANVAVSGLTVTRNTLEDVYLQLTGESHEPVDADPVSEAPAR